MKTELGIAYAQIKGGFEHDSHGFHIFFDQSSTVPCFYIRDFSYPFLSTEEEDEAFAKKVKENLESLGIHNNDIIPVLLYDGDVIAISSNGNDMWIDVREESFALKSFEEFGIIPTSIKVYI